MNSFDKNKEKKLCTEIEILRKQLNKKIDFKSNTPMRNKKTYAISRKLDRLIYQYMKIYR